MPWLFTFLVACLMAGCGRMPNVANEPSPPNLVLIMVDTLRFDAVDPDRTPAIAELGEDGIVFDSGFSHAPMTLPSITALFTSRLPSTTDIVVNGQVIPKGLLLLPEWLNRFGFRTVAVASLATLWGREPKQGLDQGFDDFEHAERDYSHWLDTLKVFREELDDLDHQKEVESQPLFLFAHFAEPHEPYRDFDELKHTLSVQLDGVVRAAVAARQAPHIRFDFDLEAGKHEVFIESPDEDFRLRSLYVYASNAGIDVRVPIEYVEGRRMGKQRRLRARFSLATATRGHIESWVTDLPNQATAARRYFDEVRWADRAVASVVAELKARGLYDSSLVIFTSDHGEAFGEHQLNGHSKNVYDELLHVPLVIKLPKATRFDLMRKRLASQTKTIVGHVDLVPTALEILGLAKLPGSTGRSLLGANDGEHILVAETHTPEAERDSYCLRSESHKLIFIPEQERFMLFDLVADPGEMQDRFTELGPEFIAWQAQLRALANSWKARQRSRLELETDASIEVLGY